MTKNKIEQLQNAFDNAIQNLMETFDELKAEVINVDKPELIMHDGKKLKRVEREAKEGDYVKFVKDFGSHTKSGKFYEVVEDTHYLDDCNGTILHVYGWEGREKAVEGVYEVEYETINRVAGVGERFLVTNAKWCGEDYQSGDIGTVKESYSGGIFAEGWARGLCHSEYEVIVEPELEIVKRAAEIGERILIVNASREQLRKPYKNGDVMTVTRAAEFNNGDVVCGDFGYVNFNEYEVILDPEQVPNIKELAANQQRAELIGRTKRFVEVKLGSLMNSKFVSGGYEAKKRENPNFYELATKVDFVVNEEKRTVVALLKGARNSKIYSRGIAKCMPNEVFNEHIGKAIALARALEIDVPDEFLNAVQPDEVEIGMLVHPVSASSGKRIYDTPRKVVGLRTNEGKKCPKYIGFYSDNWASHFKIINDTNAIYSEVTSQ